MKLGACVALLLAWSGAAPAADNSALSLYVAGKYQEAETAGVAQGDADGYALAARASLAAEMVRDQPCLHCLKRAESEARHAVALDPKSSGAHVYLAVALGYESRIVGLISARLNDYPEQAKANLDAALAADPSDAWALAGLGGWNIEVVHSGGATLARWFYGAGLTQGLEDFAKAFAASPGNLVLRYQYALSLGGFDSNAYRSQIEDSLSRAISAKPASTYESFAQGRARELLVALKANDTKTFARLVRRDQGYP
jgi:hypothetical protein